MPTSQDLNIEVVLIGYDDFRLNKTVPFGFVILASNRISAHQRIDLHRLGLPRVFGFTAKHMGAAIYRSATEHKVEKDLFGFVSKNHFSGIGSFRCCHPIKMAVHPIDFDELVGNLKSMVNQRFSEAVIGIEDYNADCDPAQWLRTPNDSIHQIEMPEVECESLAGR